MERWPTWRGNAAGLGLAQHIVGANTTPEAFALAASERIQLGDEVAARALEVAAEVLAGSNIVLDIVIFDREGKLAGRSLAKPVHAAPPKR